MTDTYDWSSADFYFAGFAFDSLTDLSFLSAFDVDLSAFYAAFPLLLLFDF